MSINVSELSERTKISRTTLEKALRGERNIRDDVYEKFYSYAYRKRFRLNEIKEELLKEGKETILFHGSKSGLSPITPDGSRSNCDFGGGFYLGESFAQASSFVYEKEGSSVYSFSFSSKGLKIKRFECDLEWMLAVCFYRGGLDKYKEHEKIRRIIEETKGADLLIAPIADNKMFYTMSQFAEGEINSLTALHSLSASNLGLQYVLKTSRAIDRLVPIERYYPSNPERENRHLETQERALAIDTKLKMAKREFRNGPYIEEIFR